MVAAHIALLRLDDHDRKTTEEFGYAPVSGKSEYQPPKLENRKDLTAAFERNGGGPLRDASVARAGD